MEQLPYYTLVPGEVAQQEQNCLVADPKLTMTTLTAFMNVHV